MSIRSIFLYYALNVLIHELNQRGSIFRHDLYLQVHHISKCSSRINYFFYFFYICTNLFHRKILIYYFSTHVITYAKNLIMWFFIICAPCVIRNLKIPEIGNSKIVLWHASNLVQYLPKNFFHISKNTETFTWFHKARLASQ